MSTINDLAREARESAEQIGKSGNELAHALEGFFNSTIALVFQCFCRTIRKLDELEHKPGDKDEPSDKT